MGRARSVIGLVNRYVHLAGRSCCVGRSWVGLDSSLERRTGDPPPRARRLVGVAGRGDLETAPASARRADGDPGPLSLRDIRS